MVVELADPRGDVPNLPPLEAVAGVQDGAVLLLELPKPTQISKSKNWNIEYFLNIMLTLCRRRMCVQNIPATACGRTGGGRGGR